MHTCHPGTSSLLEATIFRPSERIKAQMNNMGGRHIRGKRSGDRKGNFHQVHCCKLERNSIFVNVA